MRLGQGGHLYMREQHCTDVNGYQVLDFGLSLGSRLICEVTLQASIYGIIFVLIDAHARNDEHPSL